MNKVQILGTITKDIEIRYTQGGVAIASFGVAYNEKYKGQDGNYVEKAHFFDVTAFGKTAENINKFFHKGSRILIDGKLNHETWKSQDGSNRSKVSIKLENFDFIDRKADNPQYNNNDTAQKPPQQTAQSVPGTQIPLEIMDDEIPFGYIGLSEGGYYAHLI
jgi:single-strand DNA-binding protein